MHTHQRLHWQNHSSVVALTNTLRSMFSLTRHTRKSDIHSHLTLRFCLRVLLETAYHDLSIISNNFQWDSISYTATRWGALEISTALQCLASKRSRLVRGIVSNVRMVSIIWTRLKSWNSFSLTLGSCVTADTSGHLRGQWSYSDSTGIHRKKLVMSAWDVLVNVATNAQTTKPIIQEYVTGLKFVSRLNVFCCMLCKDVMREGPKTKWKNTLFL